MGYGYVCTRHRSTRSRGRGECNRAFRQVSQLPSFGIVRQEYQGVEPPDLQVRANLSGHSKCVKALAISGSILFSGSNDGSIYVWSLKNLTCLFALDAHEGWVKALAVKDKTLYSGSFDFHIKEWKVTQFQSAEILMDHNDNVNSLCLTDKYLISGSDDKSAMVWDMATRRVVAIIKGHRLGVQSVVQMHIYTGSFFFLVFLFFSFVSPLLFLIPSILLKIKRCGIWRHEEWWQ
eukprot:Phypoly_transcript_09664.p1 GENE.Phypoly_transcript_09664~~Phypoly_transcript_09664.p1  ORF type:complete len:234 (+),score=14.68 Phypoly_transcript_09664:518-1219(+)